MLTLDARLGSTKVAKCFRGGVDGETSFLTVVILWGFVPVCVTRTAARDEFPSTADASKACDRTR